MDDDLKNKIGSIDWESKKSKALVKTAVLDALKAAIKDAGSVYDYLEKKKKEDIAKEKA